MVQVSVPPEGLWGTYTPAWTSDGTQPSIGDGSISGNFCVLVGNMVSVRIIGGMGSTSTYGTGQYFWSLPFPFHADWPSFMFAGTCWMYDNSGAVGRTGMCRRNAATNTVAMWPDSAGSYAGATVPFTWANLDQFTLDFTYKAAL